MDDTKRNEVEAEVREAFEAYERALNTNDVDALIGAFADDPRTMRLTTDGGLYGIDEIIAFRKGRDVSDIARQLTRVEIVAVTPEVVVAAANYTRTVSGKKGSQTQVWQRRAEGWRIVSAHVSTN
ncbi:AtzH-like domain-containing protein [Acuticoccus yangtzensis]|uniref:AtzH-like domain-containing protein n=1 Tax=Acuticoccus yangtzensis TaxID=1443441 RepID=UPI0009499B71|nr:AtzH-like domain-containing protein [Acuticoccus yangtzensis]ORE92202.1 hypothetical protein ATO13_17769 [Stappia sp. 22II-S9-Z10]